MFTRSAFALVVICSLSSFASSARIKHDFRIEGEGPKTGNQIYADCGKAISDRTLLIMDRLFTAYFGNCQLEEEHASLNADGTEATISEEGLRLLCESRCKDDSDLSEEVPDSSDLIEQCGEDEASKEKLKLIVLHDAFDTARKACGDAGANVQVVEPLSTTTTTTTTTATATATATDEIVDSGDIVEAHDEIVDSGDIVEDHDEIVIEDVNETVDSPVAWFSGNLIKQMKFEFELKSALAKYSEGNCDKLKEAFKKCDFAGNGKVSINKVDKSLDKLRDEQKVESITLLKAVAKKANKADVDPLTFKDWLLFKLPENLAVDCALQYARGQ